MSKSDYLVTLIVSFLFGILIGEFLVSNKLFEAFVGFCFWVWLVSILGFKAGWRGFIVVFLGLLFGVARFFISLDIGENNIANYVGYVRFRGCIVDEVDVRKDKVKYVLDADEIFVDGVWESVFGKILVNGERYPVYEYGNCLNVLGEIERPGKIDDFEYSKYLARYSIYSVVYFSEIDKANNGKGNRLFEFLYGVKKGFEMRLNENFGEPHGSFMAGLILGSRRGISEELIGEFNITGLTHIVAISGYNVTLVIVVVSGMFGFLSRRVKIAFSVGFVIVFVFLVGASASVVRAGIMGIISLMALWFGREYFVFIALFVSAFLMNLWNPKILVYDVGFQLSFLATLGIVFFSPLIERYLRWLPEIFGMREAAQMTLSAQLLVLPVIVLNFGRLSLIAPVANLFVLSLIPFAMLFGFFAVLFDLFCGAVSDFFGFLGYLALETIIFFVNAFSSFRFASIGVEWGWWMVVTYYYLLCRYILKKWFY